jgi:hypothetical protein
MDITDGAVVIKAIVIFENYIRVFFFFDNLKQNFKNLFTQSCLFSNHHSHPEEKLLRLSDFLFSKTLPL